MDFNIIATILSIIASIVFMIAAYMTRKDRNEIRKVVTKINTTNFGNFSGNISHLNAGAGFDFSHK
ncbi:MAG TPA: hypothetical protein VJJ28_00450 [Candidatus Paceibacterota bacterium]